MKKVLRNKKPKSLKSKKPSDVSATYGALAALRKEFKSDQTTLRLEMRAEFKKVDARFNQVDARFNQVDARFNQVDAQFNQVDARFNQVDAQLKILHASIEKMAASNARMLAIYEEQNSRNKASYEGAESVKESHGHLEKRVEALEQFQNAIQSKLKSN